MTRKYIFYGIVLLTLLIPITSALFAKQPQDEKIIKKYLKKYEITYPIVKKVWSEPSEDYITDKRVKGKINHQNSEVIEDLPFLVKSINKMIKDKATWKDIGKLVYKNYGKFCLAKADVIGLGFENGVYSPNGLYSVTLKGVGDTEFFRSHKHKFEKTNPQLKSRRIVDWKIIQSLNLRDKVTVVARFCPHIEGIRDRIKRKPMKGIKLPDPKMIKILCIVQEKKVVKFKENENRKNGDNK